MLKPLSIAAFAAALVFLAKFDGASALVGLSADAQQAHGDKPANLVASDGAEKLRGPIQPYTASGDVEVPAEIGDSDLRREGTHGKAEVDDASERSAVESWQAYAFENVQEANDRVGEFEWRAWTPTAIFTWLIWLSLSLLVFHFGYARVVPARQVGADKQLPQHMLLNGHLDCLSEPKIFWWACLCPGLRWADTVNLMGAMPFWVAFGIYAVLSLLNYMNFFTVLAVGLVSVAFSSHYYYKVIEKMIPASEDANHMMASKALIIAIIILIGVALLSLGVTFGGIAEPALRKYMGIYGCFTWGCFTTCAMLHARFRLREMLDLPRGNFQTCLQDGCFIFWCPWCAIAQEARTVNEAYRVGLDAFADGPAADTVPSMADLGSLGGSAAALADVGAERIPEPAATDSKSHMLKSQPVPVFGQGQSTSPFEADAEAAAPPSGEAAT